jgi:hypothetical protein
MDGVSRFLPNRGVLTRSHCCIPPLLVKKKKATMQGPGLCLQPITRSECLPFLTKAWLKHHIWLAPTSISVASVQLL